MCNRTDCAGVFMGELACRVCGEGIHVKKLSDTQRIALEHLADPLCDASSYWQKGTLEALQRKGLAVKHENEMFFRWEITPSGEQYLHEATK